MEPRIQAPTSSGVFGSSVLFGRGGVPKRGAPRGALCPRKNSSLRPPESRGSGSGSPSCSRSSCWSTTRSATGCMPSIPPGLMTTSSITPGSSTRRFWRRSTRSSGPRPSHDADRHEGQLVGNSRGENLQAARKDQRERGAKRHPRLPEGPLRGSLFHHRRIRRRLQDAPAHPRRLRLPFGHRR
jgi:hypothetical protein